MPNARSCKHTLANLWHLTSYSLSSNLTYPAVLLKQDMLSQPVAGMINTYTVLTVLLFHNLSVHPVIQDSISDDDACEQKVAGEIQKLSAEPYPSMVQYDEQHIQ